MIPLEEAQARLLALAAPLPLEEVSLSQGLGRVLARPVRAARAQPTFDAAAMDGYAVTAQPAAGEWLQVVGTSRAGAAHDGVLQPGQAARIFTGAPVPEGASRVILQEDVTRDGDRITFTGRAEAAIHIRPRGADFGQGQLFDAPRRLDGVALSLLAAMGCDRLQVASAPRVAIIPTGDELVLPGGDPGPDQIICTNHLAIRAMAQAEGALVRVLPIARDTEESLGRMMDLARDADIIVTIGGASVGDHDHVARVTAARGMVPVFHKVALRPGKPALAGRMGDQLLIGLPGNPVSAMVCARLFLRPVLRALQGLPSRSSATAPAGWAAMSARTGRGRITCAPASIRSGPMACRC